MGKASKVRSAIDWRSCALALLGLFVAGCGWMQRRDTPPSFVAQQPPQPYRSVDQTVAQALQGTHAAAHSSASPGNRPLEVLVVCAGGIHSPFTAGALVGWTKAGTRPTFDIVTGTSSGALVGAFAFLGPKYDGRLQALFPSLTSADIFDLRPMRYMLRDGVAASAKPLDRLIEREVNEAFLADLREAQRQGRRLFIGTTNVETKRLVVWDLGGIASSGRPDAAVMVRKILLASATWPGLMPPVEFDVQVNGKIRREQHIDGGTAAQAFVRFGPDAAWPTSDEPAPGWLAGSNLYVLAGGKLYDDPETPPQRFLGRVLNGFSCITQSLACADMQRLHTLCQVSGMKFHLLALPDDYQGKEQSMLRIDPAEMARLFDAGYQIMALGAAWRHIPPGVAAGEEEAPRGGE